MPCQATGPLGTVRRGISAEVLDVSLPSTLELLGFARCVVGVVWVLSFRHLLFLDRRGVGPPGVIGFCALNHLAWLGGRVPVFSALQVFVVVLAPRLIGISSVVVSRDVGVGLGLCLTTLLSFFVIRCT